MRLSKMCACTNTRFTTLMFLLFQAVMTTTKPASRSSAAFFKKCDSRVDAFFLNVSDNNISICSYSWCYFSEDCLEPLLVYFWRHASCCWIHALNMHKNYFSPRGKSKEALIIWDINLGFCCPRPTNGWWAYFQLFKITHSCSWLKWPIMTSNHTWWF